MYIQIGEGLGQEQLPTSSGKLCLQDNVPLESILLSGIIIDHTLDEFNFRKSDLRTRHKTWIRRRLVPAIIRSWRTSTPMRTIVLIGHADEVGDQAVNYKLGLARAEAVRDRIMADLKRLNSEVAGKIAIKTFSQGECWPQIPGGKRERRNRRVVVWGIGDVLPPAGRTKNPAPSQSTPRRTPPRLLDLPESVKRRIEREAEQQRFWQPIPPSPRGRSLKDWFDRTMRRHGVPKWLRDRIWDAILGGNLSLATTLLDQAGIRGEAKEAILGIIRAGSQVPIR